MQFYVVLKKTKFYFVTPAETLTRTMYIEQNGAGSEQHDAPDRTEKWTNDCSRATISNNTLMAATNVVSLNTHGHPEHSSSP